MPRRPLRSPRRLYASLAVAVVALAACGDDDDTPAAGEGDADAAVVVGAVLEPESLDILHQAGAAIDQVLLDNVYETLLTTGDDGTTIEPGLASYEVSDDGTVYTLTLQDGVTFHDGASLTSADVVYSLDEARSDTGASAEDFASIDTVTAPDAATVEIALAQPDNDLLFNLTRRGGAVVRDGATDLENRAVGTGPFTLEEWSLGSSITLARFDDYWGEPATVAEVTFQYFTDPNAAVNAFTTGDADILTGVNTELVGPLQDDADYVVNQGTTNGEITLGFNNSRAPLDDAAVRMALRQAIDKQAVLDLYNGFGTIIGGPVPPTDPWYEDLTDVAPYDPEAARAALDAAGVAEGTALRLVYPDIYPISLAELIATQLGDVGLDVEIEPVQFSVWLEQVYTNADYDLTVVIHVEPRDIANYANPDYYWRYDNPEVQRLVADAKVAPTPDEATDLLRRAARQISEDAATDWLLLFADLTVSTTDVTGYPTNDTASRFDASRIIVAP
jgi:peptide/nickel transport system substrate-binding protein